MNYKKIIFLSLFLLISQGCSKKDFQSKKEFNASTLGLNEKGEYVDVDRTGQLEIKDISNNTLSDEYYALQEVESEVFLDSEVQEVREELVQETLVQEEVVETAVSPDTQEESLADNSQQTQVESVSRDVASQGSSQEVTQEQEANLVFPTLPRFYGFRSCPNFRQAPGFHGCWSDQELRDFVECEEPHGLRNGRAVSASSVSTEAFIFIVIPFSRGEYSNRNPASIRSWAHTNCLQLPEEQNGYTPRRDCIQRYGSLCRPYCEANSSAEGCAQNLSLF